MVADCRLGFENVVTFIKKRLANPMHVDIVLGIVFSL